MLTQALLYKRDWSYQTVVTLAYAAWYCRDHPDYHYRRLYDNAQYRITIDVDTTLCQTPSPARLPEPEEECPPPKSDT